MTPATLTAAEVLTHLRNCHRPTGYHVVDRNRLTCYRDCRRFVFQVEESETPHISLDKGLEKR
jgi:hypothetical protein